MNARGERIIVFGDSLTHHGSDNAAEIWDVNAGSNRSSSAPGDLVASLLAEQGAAAVRVNARVSRSAWNFWSREATNTLLASDRAFAPTKVVIMLGTNDVGLNPTLDREAFAKLRDTYKAMGAEVWAVGPFSNTVLPRAGVDQVVATMKDVFGPRFIDGRPISVLIHPGGDGVHYSTASARPLALAITDALLSKFSPATLWTTIGLGAAGVLGAIAVAFAWKRHKTRGALLGDLALPSRDSIDELIKNGDLDVAQDAMLERGDKLSQIAKISGEIGPHTFANYKLDLGEGRRINWRITENGAGRCKVQFMPWAGGAEIRDPDSKDVKSSSYPFESGYYGGHDYCERSAASDAWAMAKRLVAEPLALVSVSSTEGINSRNRVLAKKLEAALDQDNSEPEELYGLGAGDEFPEIKFRDMIRDEDPSALDVAEDYALENNLRISDIASHGEGAKGEINLAPDRGPDGSILRVNWNIEPGSADSGEKTWNVNYEVVFWASGGNKPPFVFEPIRIEEKGIRGGFEEARKQAAANAWAAAKTIKKLPIGAVQSVVRRAATKAIFQDNVSSKSELYGFAAHAGESGKGVSWHELIREDDPAAMDIAEDLLLERGWKMHEITGGRGAKHFTIDFGKSHWYGNDQGKMVQTSVIEDEGERALSWHRTEAAARKALKGKDNAKIVHEPETRISNERWLVVRKATPKIKIVVKNGDVAVKREYEVSDRDGTELRKRAVADAWAIARKLKTEPADLPQGNVEAIVDRVLLYGDNNMYGRKELFGVNIVDGKRSGASDAELTRKGYRPAACKSGLDKKALAKCWTREAINAVITNAPIGGLAGYRVAYGTSDARGTFRAFDHRVLPTLEQVTKLMRSYKRQGLWTWVEDEQGNFVPVPGAKSEKARKSYPLR